MSTMPESSPETDRVPPAAAGSPPHPTGNRLPEARHTSAEAIAKSHLTPAMRQYLEQKAEVGDAILLFRMGDFYETFFEDAKTIARVLGLTLTARNKESSDPIPLAGVPYHAADGYIARLVRAGYKVAISEQVEDPRLAKGLVRRSIDRVITPGTLTDDQLLDERRNNTLVALCPARLADWSAGPIGVALVELAGGRFETQVLPSDGLIDELARVRPAELLIPDHGTPEEPPLLKRLRESIDAVITLRPGHAFDAHLAERLLREHFRVSTLAGFGFETFDLSLCSAGAILDYLRETQRSSLAHLTRLQPRISKDRVLIDQTTLRSLEIERTIRDGGTEGTLLAAVDLTVNPMGSRRLREWLCYPLSRGDEIATRQNAISDLLGQPDRLQRIRETLREINDVERIAARVGIGRASPRDLVGLSRALRRCQTLVEQIGPSVRADAATDPDLLTRLRADLTGHEALAHYLAAALRADAPPTTRDGGYIAEGHNAELDRLRGIDAEGGRWLAEYQAREARRTGIPSLKIGYNSVFGYYIEITHQHRDKIPPEYVRKQTVRNAERYITDELKRHEIEVLGALDRARQLEAELFEEIRRRTAEQLPALQRAAEAVAVLDVIAGLAELARARGFCRPELADGSAGPVLEITDGRHPVLDLTLAERFVPNDCRLSSEGDRLLLITGPNMAGKSTYIRQVALLTLLAQTGSYVPARAMRLSPADRIFARVGASDELARGHSTFMVEMLETARILNNATSDSLVILDEIGRGTSTYDGLALAWAIAEHLAERIRCRTLFATHYHELTDLAERLPGVANYNVAVREELRPDGAGREIAFLHKIVPGATDRSYGIHVAAMAGLPACVLRRSEAILAALERRMPGGGIEPRPPGRRKEIGQMMLFAEPAPPAMPDWWRELVDAIDTIDVERTTPLDALQLLQQLRSLVRRA